MPDDLLFQFQLITAAPMKLRIYQSTRHDGLPLSALYEQPILAKVAHLYFSVEPFQQLFDALILSILEKVPNCQGLTIETGALEMGEQLRLYLSDSNCKLNELNLLNTHIEQQDFSKFLQVFVYQNRSVRQLNLFLDVVKTEVSQIVPILENNKALDILGLDASIFNNLTFFMPGLFRALVLSHSLKYLNFVPPPEINRPQLCENMAEIALQYFLACPLCSTYILTGHSLVDSKITKIVYNNINQMLYNQQDYIPMTQLPLTAVQPFATLSAEYVAQLFSGQEPNPFFDKPASPSPQAQAPIHASSGVALSSIPPVPDPISIPASMLQPPKNTSPTLLRPSRVRAKRAATVASRKNVMSPEAEHISGAMQALSIHATRYQAAKISGIESESFIGLINLCRNFLRNQDAQNFSDIAATMNERIVQATEQERDFYLTQLLQVSEPEIMAIGVPFFASWCGRDKERVMRLFNEAAKMPCLMQSVREVYEADCHSAKKQMSKHHFRDWLNTFKFTASVRRQLVFNYEPERERDKSPEPMCSFGHFQLRK